MPEAVPNRSFNMFRGLAAGLIVAAIATSCGPPQPAPTNPDRTGAPSTIPMPADSSAGSAAASATSAALSQCASRMLGAMSEEQRIGQLFVLGLEGDELSAAESAAIVTRHFGSVWLVNFRANGVGGVRALTSGVQRLATDANTHGVGFLVGADQEGGHIQRLTGPGFSTIPSALAQGTLEPAALQADALTWGRELSSAGVNLDLAPVMDVVPPGADALNQPIGVLEREYGHDPATVASHGAAVVRGMAQADVATTLKHFPGLGRVTGNTDTAAGVIDGTTTATDPYLEAFRSGIAAGAPFVMVSLATYTAIDPVRQAVFSSEIVGDLLRGRLGFDGVVMSDDLGAASAVASLAPGDRATEFIAAGGDLMIVGGVQPATQMAAAVLARTRADRTFAAQADAAALRVLRAKAALSLLSCG